MILLVQIGFIFLLTSGIWLVLPSSAQDQALAYLQQQTPPGKILPSVNLEKFTETIPVRTNVPAPDLTAASAVVMDVKTGTVIYEKDPDTSRRIASVSKIFTALLALNQLNLNDKVVIKELPKYEAAASTIGLANGETINVRNLLRAALIPSANDAADVLSAESLSKINQGKNNGLQHADSINTLLDPWQLSGVSALSPTGLTEGAGGTATARAVAQATQLLMTNKEVREMVKTREMTIKNEAGKEYKLVSTNQLLTDERIKGVKTGYTPEAGECLVVMATISGHEVVSVIIGSTDRFGETTSLINWIQTTTTWHTPQPFR